MRKSGGSGIGAPYVRVVVADKDATAMHPFPPKQVASTSLAKRFTLAAMSLGYGVVQLDVTIVNTALNSIGTSLGGGVSELQWVVSTYTIAFAALILTAGALGDRLGAKNIFMAGFAIFTAASLGCAVAPTSGVLIAARAVQGVGAAILVPNSLALLNYAYDNETERGRAVGVWAAGASLALTAGPLAGGGLIEIAGWRSIFLVNLPIGLGALWLTWRYATDTSRAQHRLDLPGQAAAIGMLGLLAGTIIEGGRLGWTNAWVLAGFAGFVTLAALFLVREQRAPEPMLPLSLFAHRMFALTSLVGLLVNIAFYGLIFVFSLYFQQINHWSPFATGLAFVPMMGAVLPVNLLAPRLAERIGAPAVIALGAIIAAAGCLGLLGLERGTPYWAICGQLLAMGGGLGLLVPPLTSTLLGSVEKSRSGVAAGVLNSTRQTGSVLGVAMFGSLIGQADAFLSGTRIALVISAALLIAAAAAIMSPELSLAHRRPARAARQSR
jgi:DHA2 family methylenomycin A resistance protein-like MFS transporter